MALIKMVNACHIFGRTKLVRVFNFWFDKDVISLYNYFKYFAKADEIKKTHDTSK